MEEILKSKGFKVTPARLSILEVFSRNKFPVTAESIYKELRKDKKCKYINEATVYRTIAAFEKKGVITRVHFGSDAYFFELAKEHHHHATCIKCYKVEDFNSKAVEKILKNISSSFSKFININSHSLELFGLCKNCHR